MTTQTTGLTAVTCKAFQHHFSEVREKVSPSSIYLYNKGPAELNVRVRGCNNLYGEGSRVCSGAYAGDERCYLIRQGVHYVIDNGVNHFDQFRYVQIEYFVVENLPCTFVWAPDCVLDRYESYVQLTPTQLIAVPLVSDMAVTNTSGVTKSPIISTTARDLVPEEDAVLSSFGASTRLATASPRTPLTPRSPQQQLTYSQFAARYPARDSPGLSQVAESQRHLGFQIAQYAREQIGKLFGHGTCGPAMFDNPGLAFAAHRAVGIAIGRTAYTQSLHGRNVLYSCLEPGDLIFFDIDRCGYPCDVAVSLGGSLMVHAPLPQQEIRMDRLDAYWYSMIKCARRYW